MFNVFNEKVSSSLTDVYKKLADSDTPVSCLVTSYQMSPPGTALRYNNNIKGEA